MMQKIALALLLAILSYAPLVFANEALDRKPLVENAYRMFPGLVKYVRKTHAYKALSESEKGIIDSINLRLIDKRPDLIYVNDSAQFIISPGEAPRLMRTPEQATDQDQIFINESLLQDESLQIDFGFLQKLFFHEMSHKIGEPNLGLRDKLAQFFENQLRPHMQIKELGSNLELLIFSLPHAQVDVELEKVGDDELQPTNLLLLKRGHTFVDITGKFNESMKQPIHSMRPIWAELNKALYTVGGILQQLVTAFTQSIIPHAKQLLEGMMERQLDFSNIEDQMRVQDFLLSELRIIEVHESESVQLKDAILVSMKATFVISRTAKSMGIIFNGKDSAADESVPNVADFMPMQDSFPVPVKIQLTIPRVQDADLKKTNVDIQIRPEVDYAKVAKVGQIIRGNGSIATMKVRIPFGTKPPRLVQLSVHYGSGSLLVTAKKVSKLTSDTYEAEFEMDPSFYNRGIGFFADSVLLNSIQTLYLDRLIELTGSDALVAKEELGAYTTAMVLPKSLGFLGVQRGQMKFATEFGSGNPLMMGSIDGDPRNPFFTVDPRQVTLEFKLRSTSPVKQVRFHFQQEWTVFNIGKGETEGKDFVKKIKKDSWFEVVSADGKNLRISAGEPGVVVVRTAFNIPLELRDKLKSQMDISYAGGKVMPTILPIMVEIVTEDLQTVRHYFQSAPCESKLTPAS